MAPLHQHTNNAINNEQNDKRSTDSGGCMDKGRDRTQIRCNPDQMTTMDRRLLKAGTFIIIDTSTGNVEAMRRKTGKEQKAEREEFVIDHLGLCLRAFQYGTGHSDARSNPGRKLVALARQELGYSKTTGSGDIYVGLYGELRRMKLAQVGPYRITIPKLKP